MLNAKGPAGIWSACCLSEQPTSQECIVSRVSGQTQSLSPVALQPEDLGFSTVPLGKGLSDADDRVSLPDLDDPDLYGGPGATSFPPRTGVRSGRCSVKHSQCWLWFCSGFEVEAVSSD